MDLPGCVPGHGCFHCPYDDCKRGGSVTKEESLMLIASGVKSKTWKGKKGGVPVAV